MPKQLPQLASTAPKRYRLTQVRIRRIVETVTVSQEGRTKREALYAMREALSAGVIAKDCWHAETTLERLAESVIAPVSESFTARYLHAVDGAVTRAADRIFVESSTRSTPRKAKAKR